MHFLIQFAASLPAELCHAELDALLKLEGFIPRVVYARDAQRDPCARPLVVAALPDEDAAARTLGRAIGIKNYVTLWSAPSCGSLHDAVQTAEAALHSGAVRLSEVRGRIETRARQGCHHQAIAAAAPPPAAHLSLQATAGGSWRVLVDSCGRILTMAQQAAVRDHFAGAWAAFSGPVRLRGRTCVERHRSPRRSRRAPPSRAARSRAQRTPW
jgi:hypothetical protein